ncbi:DDE-type integrase/transposase/recombinase [Pseudoalteromonas sp. PPB1]|uniref:DDE-type integrase/transposase/recombinase n=1 Tax=Pseudoalteromonas sp. PPB1 TaxID=2756136 RepID=UPI001891A303|nr:DDE-type integrase/transposase/recombinase [Pseudoalteromonas sp. PPB1]
MYLKPDQLREISWVCEVKPGCSHREGAQRAQCSHQSFGRMKKVVEAKALSYAYVDSISDTKLLSVFYPNLITRQQNQKRLPNKDRIIETRIRRKGKRRITWIALFLEYESADPSTAYRLTQFKHLARQMIKEYQASMKQYYEPGECLFIDYAGLTVPMKENGQTERLYVFVAVLGYSKRLFAFATRGMTTRDWLYALKQALAYFGGVTEVIHSDNATALVKQPGLIPIYRDETQHFFRHYKCLGDTSRVATSQDNAVGENGVKIVTYSILNRMQDILFTTLPAVNSHIRREIDKLNSNRLQGCDFSRDDVFYAEEQQSLAPLPAHAFRYLCHKQVLTVPATYLVPYLHHHYSVPYKFIGKPVEIRVYDDDMIDIQHNHERIAQHRISDEHNGVTILAEHMPAEHREDAKRTKESFVAWGEEQGKAAAELMARQYDLTRNTRSRHVGKRCIALQKCCAKAGTDVFELACAYALEKQQYHPTYVEMVTRARPWELPQSNSPDVQHGNIRGPEYFGGSGHE